MCCLRFLLIKILHLPIETQDNQSYVAQMVPNQIGQQWIRPGLLRHILGWPLEQTKCILHRLWNELDPYFQRETFEPSEATRDAIDRDQAIEFCWILQLEIGKFEGKSLLRAECLLQNVLEYSHRHQYRSQSPS